jgi:AcrR family transcriptional regulator
VEAILEATLQVLVHGGQKKLTTTAVAERAGVSVGTLYQYFPDKKSLVTALKLQYVERLLGAVTDAARASTGLSLDQAVRAMLRALIDVKRKNLELTVALREPMADVDGARFARQATAKLVQAVHDVIVAAEPQTKNADLAARVIVASVEGAVTLGMYEDKRLLASPAFLDELCALVVGYLRART